VDEKLQDVFQKETLPQLMHEDEMAYMMRISAATAERAQLEAEGAGRPSSVGDIFKATMSEAERKAFDRPDLLKFFLSLSITPTAGDISQIMEIADGDKDGLLDEEEFCKLFHTTAAANLEFRSDETPQEESHPEFWDCENEQCNSKTWGLSNEWTITICPYCDYPRPDLKRVIPGGDRLGVPPGHWRCPKCSLFNKDSKFYCDACASPKPS